MIEYLVSPHGQYLRTLTGSAEENLAQVLEGHSTSLLPPPRTTDYWSGSEWVAIGSAPAYYFKYDYEQHEWVDTRDIEAVRISKRQAINLDRNKLEVGGLMYMGKRFDSDYISQSRMLAAIFFAKPTVWTLANDDSLEMSEEDLKGLGVALSEHVTGTHYRGRIAKQAVDIATSIEEIESVLF